MATSTEIVTAFLATWERPGGFEEGVHAYFTPDTVWENVGMSKTTGPAEAAALYGSMGGDGPPMLMRVDNLAVAVDGNKVLTERLDHILGPDGQPAMTVPVMGTFEVENGKITAWRDYFDTAGMAQMPG